jgi:hypothetical protein
VAGNPIRFVDPLGLVKWDCSFGFGTANNPLGFGSGALAAKCKSECAGGKSVSVSLAGTSLGLSAGLLPFGAAFSKSIELKDPFDTPSAKSLEGKYVIGSASFFIPGGAGCTQVIFGSAKSGISCGFEPLIGGLDVGLDIYAGATVIVQQSTSCCS